MEYSEEAMLTVWAVSLAIAVVVIAVVAFLLHKVRDTAKEIDVAVVNIWTEGKLLANNTIHIPNFLSVTNRAAGNILANAVQIVQGSDALKKHASVCPGCPACVYKPL